MTDASGGESAEEARASVTQMRASEVLDLVRGGDALVFLDVREANEWNLGHIPGALHLPRGDLESEVERILGREQKVVVYCARGNRSALAALALQRMGYTSVVSMSDGWAGWIGCDGEVED